MSDEKARLSERWDKGDEQVRQASAEALEYMNTLIPDIDKPEYRQMVANTHIEYVAMAEALINKVMPIYEDMRKTFKKKKLTTREGADVLAMLFMARVYKNLLEAEDGEA